MSGRGIPGHKASPTSERTIGRLSLYRRILGHLKTDGRPYIHSHQIAALCGVTPAQVRRDLMSIGYSGSPNRGYDTSELLWSIEDFLYDSKGQNVALVGVGNLGRAILAYFTGRRPRLTVVAAFDNDPAKHSRVILGCRCHPLEQIEPVVRAQGIQVGILTVPASAAQQVAERLVEAGVTGLLNFAPVALRLPLHVHVEDIDLAMSLEKVAFFSRRPSQQGAVTGRAAGS
jgi:redox-sensing transcriptional repressor